MLINLSTFAQVKKHNDCIGDFVKNCKCQLELEENDTNKLKKLNWGFYRNDSGHLYDLTLCFKENAPDKLVFYLNGCVLQDIDIETLVSIDSSMHLKDKNNYYYAQPTSGGLQYINMTAEVDSASFKVLKTKMDYYAIDKKYLYYGSNIAMNRKQGRISFVKNKTGEIVRFVQGKKVVRCE